MAFAGMSAEAAHGTRKTGRRASDLARGGVGSALLCPACLDRDDDPAAHGRAGLRRGLAGSPGTGLGSPIARRSVPGAAPPELRPHEPAVAPGAALLAPGLLLDGEVAGTPAVGEGQAFRYQDRAHVLAADEADRELARMPVDELLVDLTAEPRHRHQLIEPPGRDRPAIEEA